MLHIDVKSFYETKKYKIVKSKREIVCCTQGTVCCVKVYTYGELYFIDDLLIGIAINKELMTPYGQHGVYNAVFCGLKTVRDYRDRRKVSVWPYTG